jgi:arginase
MLASLARGTPPRAGANTLVARSMKVTIIGVPMDLGAGRRGVDMGPSAIRHAGLHEMLRRLGCEVEDAGDVPVPVAESRVVREEDLRFLDEIVTTCRHLADAVERLAGAGRVPIVLGGDHSIAMGTIAGLARVSPRVGLLYFDAHGDFNTPAASPSGNIHGMPLAVALGVGDERLLALGPRTPMVRREDAALIGIRDVDAEEKRLIRELGPASFTVRDVDERGMRSVMEECIALTSGCERLHVSFDMDVLDPMHAPGTGTPVEGGLTLREAHLAMEMLADGGRVQSLEIVETNPILDTGNRTGQLAAGLIASCLGKRIL